MKSFGLAVLVSFGVFSGASSMAQSFDQWKQRADTYRDSGQMQADAKAREERERIKEIPFVNRKRMQSIRQFAAHNGGGLRMSTITRDENGKLDVIEFSSRKLSCQFKGNNGACVNTQTLAQYKCAFGYFWNIACW